MRTPTRHLTAAGSAAVLAITLLAAAPAAAGSHRQGIDWQPCPDAAPGDAVECATIEVPLDYDRPRGETIEIGLARRQALDPDERIGTVLMDPGGPGGSGVGDLVEYNPLNGEAAERFDIVGFDPRGVNTSTRVLCGEEAANAVAAIGVPSDQASFEALEDANAALAADCRERTGKLFDHVSNLETVEDMERIRRALGERRLNYLGYSYGTIMGQQYAEAYPHRIRTMVLDGNMDHSLAGVWDYMSTETAAVEENFAAFADWCENASGCALHGVDIEALYADIKAEARAGTLTDPATGGPLDFYALSMRYTFAANRPQAWPTLAEGYAAMRDGAALRSIATLEADTEVDGLFLPAWCQDFGWQIEDYDELASLQRRLTEAYPNVEWTPYDNYALTCVGSGIEHVNEREELDIDHAPPIVFIGNEHDPSTAYEWTLAAAEQAGGHLITYEGYGHTVYSEVSPCIDAAVNAYFVHRTVPEEGLSCPNLDFPDVGALTAREAPRTAGPF